MKKVGFYGGTFDPFHFGHLNLIYHALESQLVDEVFVVPNYKSPAKQIEPIASINERIEMCKLAVGHHHQIKVLEIEKNASCYTIDSLNELKKKFPDLEFRLLIGSDQIQNFHLWKNYLNLIKEFSPIAFSRGKSISIPKITHVPIANFEISSTDIRLRFKKKLPVDHLIPMKVLDYINHHHLYS
jgi:nicotinate-nucleotide adenylyltransferase